MKVYLYLFITLPAAYLCINFQQLARGWIDDRGRFGTPFHQNKGVKSKLTGHEEQPEASTVTVSNTAAAATAGIHGARDKPHDADQKQQKENESSTVTVSTTSNQTHLTLDSPKRAASNATVSCQRKCKNFNNKIVLIMNGGAGINDRRAVINTLGKYAGFLCATVHVPSPAIMLSKKHNGGNPLSNNLTWDDFVKYEWLEAGHQAVPPVHTYFGQGDPSWGDSRYLKIWTNAVNPIHTSFQQAEALVLDQLKGNNSTYHDAFLWRMDGNWHEKDGIFTKFGSLAKFFYGDGKNKSAYYKSPLVAYDDKSQGVHCNTTPLPRARRGWVDCGTDYVKSRMPPLLVSLAENVFHQISFHQPADAAYTLFHIRRGDATEQCDTTLPTLKQYLSCSFNNTTSLHRKFVVLLGSDEKDKEYRQSIIQLTNNVVDAGTGEKVQVETIDLDELVRETLNQAIAAGDCPDRNRNNFFVYLITQEIGRRALLTLERRRGSACRPCDKLRNVYERKMAKGSLTTPGTMYHV